MSDKRPVSLPFGHLPFRPACMLTPKAFLVATSLQCHARMYASPDHAKVTHHCQLAVTKICFQVMGSGVR